MKNIDAIIFDLGGVLLNIDYHLTSRKFKDLGVSNFDEIYSQAGQTDAFDLFETGQIAPSVFYSKIAKLTKTPIQETHFWEAWNAMLLEMPKERIDFIHEISAHYKTFLLSNTNAVHVKAFENSIDQNIGLSYFKSAFKNLYYSNEIGLRKPNVNAFEFVLRENNLTAENTLFIDDSIQHVEGAKKAGINAVLLKSNESVIELINSMR